MAGFITKKEKKVLVKFKISEELASKIKTIDQNSPKGSVEIDWNYLIETALEKGIKEIQKESPGILEENR